MLLSSTWMPTHNGSSTFLCVYFHPSFSGCQKKTCGIQMNRNKKEIGIGFLYVRRRKETYKAL